MSRAETEASPRMARRFAARAERQSSFAFRGADPLSEKNTQTATVSVGRAAAQSPRKAEEHFDDEIEPGDGGTGPALTPRARGPSCAGAAPARRTDSAMQPALRAIASLPNRARSRSVRVISSSGARSSRIRETSRCRDSARCWPPARSSARRDLSTSS